MFGFFLRDFSKGIDKKTGDPMAEDLMTKNFARINYMSDIFIEET
jgi:hypothetical protein